ncbi:MAG: glycine--tRNA ligase [Candidatus Altiarchaeota archaeon]
MLKTSYKSGKMYDKILDISKRRGISYPSFEIYGGVSGFYDYGPIGTRIKKNIEEQLRKRYVIGQGCMEVECPTLGPESMWIASGHVKSFTDLMSECIKCGEAYRIDHLIENQLGVNVEGRGPEDIQEYVDKLACPKCKGGLSSPYNYNLMFETSIGPGKDRITAYLRPETAQSTYLAFKRLWEFARKRLPFGVMQVGHSFRNEISPRQGMIRLREFNQAEIQFFTDPECQETERFSEVEGMKVRIKDKNDGEGETTLGEAYEEGVIGIQFIAYQLGKAVQFFTDIGVDPDRLTLRQHRDDERSFYSSDTWDVEYLSDTFGKIELVGIADRGQYDLSQHMEHSKEDLRINVDGRKFIPKIIEVAYGIDRPFYCTIESCFREEEDRTYFSFPVKTAPYTASVFPLVKKDGLAEKARVLYEMLRENGVYIIYDESGSIGKRYARSDEVGIPYSITVDYDTMKDDTVTIRERDGRGQKRVALGEILGNLV